jgi:hypothetical protein
MGRERDICTARVFDRRYRICPLFPVGVNERNELSERMISESDALGSKTSAKPAV